MKKILVPVDFSQCAENALRYAMEIAKKLNSSVRVYHGYHFIPEIDPSYSSAGYLGEQLSQIEAMLKEQMNAFLKPYRHQPYEDRSGQVELHAVLKPGTVADDVEEMVSMQHFNLVVMGTRGASGLEEKLLGSITVSVADSVRCPLLVVPEEAAYTGFKHILYATDFDADDVHLIDELIEFADYFDGNLECVHINTDQSRLQQEQNAMLALEETFWFTTFRKVNFELVREKSVARALEHYAEEYHIDMIAVLSQDRPFLDRLFHTSVSKKLARHSSVPVLILKKRTGK